MDLHRRVRTEHVVPRYRLAVLGSFELTAEGGSHPVLSGGSRRLLAFLALRGRPVARDAVAGVLWPDASERHAASCLRSTIARLGSVARAALEVSATELRLDVGVEVDLVESRRLADRLLDPRLPTAEADLGSSSLPALSADVLPDWYDEWVVTEHEAWRQRRLHALEALANRLAAARRWADAISAALAAIHAEPLRESARRTLVRIHLAEGNHAEARKEYARFRSLLLSEIGMEPTVQLADLAHGRSVTRSSRSGHT